MHPSLAKPTQRLPIFKELGFLGGIKGIAREKKREESEAYQSFPMRSSFPRAKLCSRVLYTVSRTLRGHPHHEGPQCSFPSLLNHSPAAYRVVVWLILTNSKT